MNERSEIRLAQARWAVGVWADFPVHRVPRPLVLADAEVKVEEGFRTGEAQDAFEVGWLDWRVDVPDGVRQAVQRNTGMESVVPVPRPLAITHAGRDEFSFQTDRGPRDLPAWWLHGPELLKPVWVLDPTIERWTPAAEAGGEPPAAPTQIPPLWAPIEIAPDGREITFHWLQEAPQGETIQRVDGIETDTAVSLAVIVEPKSWEPGVGYTLQGITRRITAWLEAPLGARVFVGLHGEPIEVIPASGAPQQTPRPWPSASLFVSR